MQEKKYLITFDLKNSTWNYTGFYSALQNIGPWWHYIQSTWIIKTRSTPEQIYNTLRPHLSANDYIIIVEILPGNKFGWLPTDAWNWLDN